MNSAEPETIRPTAAKSYSTNSMKCAPSMGLYLYGSISLILKIKTYLQRGSIIAEQFLNFV